MGVLAGNWSILYDYNETPPQGVSSLDHARAQVAAFDVTLAGVRGVLGHLRLELIRVAETPPSSSEDGGVSVTTTRSDHDSADEHSDMQPHATLTQQLAALKMIYD